MIDIRKELADLRDETIQFRRYMHQHPELSGKEYETTERILREIKSLGLEYLRPAPTGVIAVLHGVKEGPVIGLRADMDALPVIEETGLPYASVCPGVMHACGHDAHTASLMAAMKILCNNRDQLRGTVKFIFQPSEEYLPSGAESMMQNGDLDDCEAIFGIHVKSDLPVGKISVQSGPRMAGSAGIRIRVRGKSGHAGMPADAVDATVAGAAILMNLQTIVSRELSLDNMAVVSIGSFHSGNTQNILSGEAIMEGTCRYYSEAAISHVIEAVERISCNTAEAYRAEAEVSVIPSGCGPVINDSRLSVLSENAVKRIFGPDTVAEYPISGLNEDFSKYASICPIMYILIGAQNDDLFEPYPLHSPRLQLDERCMEYAAGTFIELAIEYLS